MLNFVSTVKVFPKKRKTPIKLINTITGFRCSAQGNDFICLDWSQFNQATSDQLLNLCDRKQGFGCDQLMVIKRLDTKIGQAESFILNQDLTEVDLCLNAAYALSQVLFQQIEQRSWSFTQGQNQFKVDTTDGGTLKFGLDQFSSASAKLMHLSLNNQSIQGYLVNPRNQHYLIPCDDPATFNLDHIAQPMQYCDEFPDGINVSCFQWVSASEVHMRIFERGVGPTQSCGSAGLAVWLNQYLHHQHPDISTIHQPGGCITIKYNNSTQALQWKGHYTYMGPFTYYPHTPYPQLSLQTSQNPTQ